MPDAQRVNRGTEALAKRLAGRSLNRSEQAALDWLQKVSGAKRPLENYAARTRRRYLAAARSGTPPTTKQSSSNYAKRKRDIAQKSGGLTPKQYTEINKLVKQRNMLLERSVAIDWDILSNFILVFGFEHVRDILADQIDSIQRYLEGNSQVVRERWFDRMHEEYPEDVTELFGNTDILYYYHGRKG